MTFVNEYISPEDRKHYQLELFEKQFSFLNPQSDWAIDRERGIFIRVINPAAWGSQPDDPEAHYEKDFHFHWQGYDYLVSTCRVDNQEFLSLSGEVFQSDNLHEEGARVLRFYLRHMGEMGKPSPTAPSALVTQRYQVLKDLESILAYGEGGVFAGLTPEQTAESRYAILKIAPHAEITVG